MEGQRHKGRRKKREGQRRLRGEGRRWEQGVREGRERGSCKTMEME